MKQERIETIYDQLGELVVELSRDPVSMGPSYLQDLIARTRGYLNIASNMVHEVHRQKSAIETELDAKEAAFLISSDSLLADDARVTRLPNIEDRKAMINLILRDDRAEILKLKNQVKELGFVDKAIRHRHKELDNTMSAIRMQKALIDSELRTGAFYGDETETSRKSAYKAPTKAVVTTDSFAIDDSELLQLLDGSTEPKGLLGAGEAEEDEEPQSVVVAPAKEPKAMTAEESADSQAVEKFLEGDDYSGLFDNL